MIDPATGELSFNGGALRFGPRSAPESLQGLRDAPGPHLVRSMTTKALPELESFPGMKFSVHLDFLKSTLTGVRLMAKSPEFPPDLTDWSLDREMARHDFHCLWIRRQLGWLWRLRRYPWGRVQALCGRNLDQTPRESIIWVVYVEFAEIEEQLGREFGS